MNRSLEDRNKSMWASVNRRIVSKRHPPTFQPLTNLISRLKCAETGKLVIALGPTKIAHTLTVKFSLWLSKTCTRTTKHSNVTTSRRVLASTGLVVGSFMERTIHRKWLRAKTITHQFWPRSRSSHIDRLYSTTLPCYHSK